jgi:C-terminal processing protease CtpA/Prc
LGFAAHSLPRTGDKHDNRCTALQVMSSMLSNLKDGHVNLTTPYGTYAYTGWYSQYPTNFISTTAVAHYFSADYGTTAGGYLRYARIADSIGYIYIGPNLLGDQTLWSQAIDVIINTLKECKGIIVDIRNNGGGNDALGNIVAGRFADQLRVYSYVRYRSGPSHSDFTDYQAVTIEPQGPRQFTKPVALLTNRHCFSSAEGTILMMKALPNVTVIGDTTGGGSANPITLTLPNGWSYRVSRWIQYTAQKTIFEGTGLPPNIPLWISSADAIAGRDAILERAIQFLR